MSTVVTALEEEEKEEENNKKTPRSRRKIKFSLSLLHTIAAEFVDANHSTTSLLVQFVIVVIRFI